MIENQAHGTSDVKSQYYLGVELGSTRIKSILLNNNLQVVGTGTSEWESQLKDGYWTYSEEQIWNGLHQSIQSLKDQLLAQNNKVSINKMGISALMHGYLVFDENDKLLVPFRTYRNTTTRESANILSDLFSFNIPQRWSIAHLYQAILNQEDHVNQIAYITTLSGYIHWQLTGEKVLGIGDASGLFPIDNETNNYNEEFLKQFNELLVGKDIQWKIEDILPKVLVAGEPAGQLTERGNLKLALSDISNTLPQLCPPEGDAGTGMVATNSIKKKSCNISIGTTAFMMVVLQDKLKGRYKEVDIVTTPTGDNVAMIHTNNCSSEINAWVKLFEEVLNVFDVEVPVDTLFSRLFNTTKQADEDNNLVLHAFHSGENVFDLTTAKPFFVRESGNPLKVSNIMKANLYSAFVPLRHGVDILHKNEVIEIEKTIAHGGLFNTPVIAQQILANALKQTITVRDFAGEGGAWGIALLAAYIDYAKDYSLSEFLKQFIFVNTQETTITPTSEGIADFNDYYTKFVNLIGVQKQIQ